MSQYKIVIDSCGELPEDLKADGHFCTVPAPATGGSAMPRAQQNAHAGRIDQVVQQEQQLAHVPTLRGPVVLGSGVAVRGERVK